MGASGSQGSESAAVVGPPGGRELRTVDGLARARHSTRKYDWNALKFQADYDPKYRRAQMRYVGTGGTGVAADANAIPAEHFTVLHDDPAGRRRRPAARAQRRRGDLLRAAREG